VFPASPKGDENVSARSLAQLAEDRDTKQPGQSVNGSTGVLVATVPTEALTAYTAVIGVVLAANIGASYGPFRWSAYGVFIVLAVLAPLVLVKRRAAATTGKDMRAAATTGKDMRKVPVPECLAAGVAAAAWGLVMPGNPLSMIIKGNALVFATTAILVGSAAMISLAAQQLGTANSRNATQTEGAAPAAQEEAPLAAADEVAPPAQEEAPLADQRPRAALDGASSAAVIEDMKKKSRHLRNVIARPSKATATAHR